MDRRRQLSLVLMALAALVGGALIGRLSADDGGGVAASEPEASTTTVVTTTLAPTTTTAPAPLETVPATTAPPVTTTTREVFFDVAPPTPLVAAPPSPEVAAQIGKALAPITLPSDCPLPLDNAYLLPNAPREYRGGTHRGVDFKCPDEGFLAVAAMPGKVVFAHDGWEDPSTAERDAILDDAIARGTTPPWTLAMLYGRFVVVDHGQVDGVGHVATLYAHLESITPGVQQGAVLEAGAEIGEIGNSGTSSGALDNGEGIHLHWEIYVDDVFLGAGLRPSEVAAIYRDLFAAPAG